MSIRGRVAITSPDRVDVTLQVTMTLAEWKLVKQEIGAPGSYEGTRLHNLVSELIFKAQKSIEVRLEDVEEHL